MERRRYHPNPKHEQPGSPGRKENPLNLNPLEAEELLNDPVNCVQVPGKRQFVAVKNDMIYVFQDDNIGGYHAYSISGNEFCTKYPAIQRQVAGLLNTTVKRLAQSDE